MNYSEDHIALAAEYALGTLSADERALVETMMIVDHGFMEVVDAWDRKLSPLHQMVAPIEPPAHLWDNISAALGLVGPQPEPVEEPKPEEPVAAPQPEQMPTIADQAGEPERTVAVAGSPDASADTAAIAAAAASDIIPEPVAAPSNVVPLPARTRGGSAFGWVMTAVAASLAAVIALQANRPELLPEQLRVKPQIKVVEVAAPAQPPAPAAQFVAVLQQNAAAPAFILTVDTATKNFTVRKVSAAPEPGKSYELWLVSDKL